MTKHSQGFQINKMVVNNCNSEQIVTCEHHVFSKKRLFEYKQMFNQLLSEGKFKDCSFEDNKWRVISNEYGTRNWFYFHDLPSMDITLALKSFTLLMIKDGMSLSNTCAHYSSLRQAIEHLFPFDNESVDKYKQIFFSTNNVYTPYETALICKRFFKFFKVPVSETIIQFFDQVKKEPNKIRKLPNYESIILFNERLLDYFNDPLTTILNFRRTNWVNNT